LLAQFQALQVGSSLIAELLTACLNGEVFLCLSNFRFARVAVLGDKIAGKA
jgi:hypothetical protein